LLLLTRDGPETATRRRYSEPIGGLEHEKAVVDVAFGFYLRV
jgi:hypothetical protein